MFVQLFEKKQSNQTIANKLALIQLVVTILIATGFWFFQGDKSAISALTGGVICALATWTMAAIMFARKDANAGQMLTTFYLGEASKVLITVICFILAFVVLEVKALPFILTYIAMLIMHWLALLKINN